MLDMAIAACRDPEPGTRRRCPGDDRRGAERGGALLETEDGVRPAIDLVYRAIVRAATEIPDGAPEQTTIRPR